ncbi:hypothetical protein Tco_0435130 [Tanacetum coccineum]
MGLGSLGPERQHDVAASAPRVAQDAHVIDEGGQADLAPVQPPPPPAATRTMPQRMAKLEEDMHEWFRVIKPGSKFSIIVHEYVLTITSEEAYRAYQEIFRMMDDGWMVTRTE